MYIIRLCLEREVLLISILAWNPYCTNCLLLKKGSKPAARYIYTVAQTLLFFVGSPEEGSKHTS